MTREEAIKLLSVLWERHAHIDKYDIDKKYMWTDGDYVEALDIAIKVLEQETMRDVDCISRQAVLDMLEDINAETDGVGFFYYEHYVDYIKALPSVNPKLTGYCEDCKHFYKLPYHKGAIGKCIHHTGFCPPKDWYCADYESQESEG